MNPTATGVNIPELHLQVRRARRHYEGRGIEPGCVKSGTARGSESARIVPRQHTERRVEPGQAYLAKGIGCRCIYLHRGGVQADMVGFAGPHSDDVRCYLFFGLEHN